MKVQCPDPEDVSAEGFKGQSEKGKDDSQVEAVINLPDDPVSNPSNDPNFFNYFMSQFVRCVSFLTYVT